MDGAPEWTVPLNGRAPQGCDAAACSHAGPLAHERPRSARTVCGKALRRLAHAKTPPTLGHRPFTGTTTLGAPAQADARFAAASSAWSCRERIPNRSSNPGRRCPARTAWHSRTYMILAAAIAVKLVLNGVVPRLSPVRMSVHLHTPEDCVPTTQRSKNAPGISPVIGAGVLESRCHRHWRSQWK